MKALPFSELWRNKGLLSVVTVIALIAIAIGAMGMLLLTRVFVDHRPATHEASVSGHDEEDKHVVGEDHGEKQIEDATVTLPKEKWSVAGLSIRPAERGTLPATTWVTGKLSLNEDRLANVHSLADGRVHEVNVRFGDDVREGQVLAIIDSKEVGEAKLELYRARLDAEFAQVNNAWTQKINTNAQSLISELENQPLLDEVDKKFREKPMGEYRQQLMSAYARLYKSRSDYQRLEPLASQGVAAGKQVLAAKATYEADRATFQALMEQLKFEAPQRALLAEQQLRQSEQAMAAARSRLFILGYKQADLRAVDPVKEGEAMAHYEIRAPFDGTVIGKSVVLAERVGPETEMFQIADLSTLWVQADLYQKDLPKLDELSDTLRFRSPEADHVHTAKIFYTGDILDPETRTIRLRAVVENPERHLKAGMFVEVALPGETLANVVTVPATALLEIDGQDAVFVQTGEDQFERRDIVVGAHGNGVIQIREGLRADELVVVTGVFALKSELMKGQISHGH